MVTHIEESRESNFLLWLEMPFVQESTQRGVCLRRCISAGSPGSDGRTRAGDVSPASENECLCPCKEKLWSDWAEKAGVGSHVMEKHCFHLGTVPAY